MNDADELLFRLQKKQAIKRPTKRNQNSLYNLIDTSESLLQSESEWIQQSDDLLALARDADYGWFNSRLEDILRTLSRKLTLVCIQDFCSHSDCYSGRYRSNVCTWTGKQCRCDAVLSEADFFSISSGLESKH